MSNLDTDFNGYKWLWKVILDTSSSPQALLKNKIGTCIYGMILTAVSAVIIYNLQDITRHPMTSRKRQNELYTS